MRDLFNYIDFQYSNQFMTSEWSRVHIGEVEKLRLKHAGNNCFTTIQLFKNNQNTEGELQFVPIYFDLDYKDDVQIALLDARSIVEYFLRMEVPHEHIRITFSGSKGFHIVITPELFGIRPHQEMTYIVKNACTYVAHQLDLLSFDHRVYSIRRMWRLPQSVHQKTGLYCTELSHRELKLSIDEIRQIAKGVKITGEDRVIPRDMLWDDDELYKGVEPLPVCQNWFEAFMQEYSVQRDMQNLRPRQPIKAIGGENPVCITDLLANSIRKEGTRNQGEMALASYYKDTGVEAGVALPLVNEWALQIPKNLTSKNDKKSLEADVKGVIKTVYDEKTGDRYHFACHFIRALGTGTDKPINCAYEKCKFVNPDDQEPEKPIYLKLPEATRSVYIGKRIETEIMVSGKDDAPYGIPVHIKVKCKPDMERENSVCKICPLAVFGGVYDLKFTAKDPNILSLLDTSEATQKHFLRRRCGIPDKCNRHRIEIVEYTNVIEIMVIPRIAFTPDTIMESEPYVVRKAFFVGHDIESNREYAISAYTFPDPRTQHLVHVIDVAKPLSDDLIEFNPTVEVLATLQKFQVQAVSGNGNGNNSVAKAVAL